MVQKAAKIGEEACKYAYEHKGYYLNPQSGYIPTYNIGDSIGSAVYVDGVLREDTIRYAVNPPVAKDLYLDKGWGGSMSYISGRQALERYWKNNQTLPRSRKNVIEIVCVAATFYSGILEHSKIQVISAAADYLASVASDPQYKDYKPRLNAVESGLYLGEHR